MTNDDRLQTFAAKMQRIETALAKACALTSNHMNADPEAVTWGDIAEAERLATALERAIDPWEPIRGDQV